MAGLHFGLLVAAVVVVSIASSGAADPETTTVTVSPVPGAPDTKANCSKYTNQTECCGDTNCAFVWCAVNASLNHTGCHNLFNSTEQAEVEKICSVNKTELNSTNQCSTTPSTPSPPTTTPAPGLNCSSLNESSCCGDIGKSLSCEFINCTRKDNTKHETMCVGSTNINATCNSTVSVITICINGSTTPLPLTTTQSPTTQTPSPAPTLSPTTNTTVKPGPTTTSTNAPPATTPASHTDNKTGGQHFDAASFIGGMILMGGLIVLTYFGLKFYRARKDKNYRTL